MSNNSGQSQLSNEFFIPFVELDIPQNPTVLSTGSFGNVCIGEWQGREVAIKKMHVMESEDLYTQAMKKEMINEASNSSQFRSPSIASYFGYSVDKRGVYHIVTEYIENGTLESVLSKERKKITGFGLTVPEKLQIALDVAYGIRYIHQKGFIHRDVRPRNILITQKFRAKICDFGLTRPSGSIGEPIGSPMYIAPEIRHAAGSGGVIKHTIQSDIYSFGLTLFSLFENKNMSSHVEMKSLSKVAKFKDIANVIRKCSAEKPSNRFSSFNPIITYLQRIKSKLKPVARKSIRIEELEEIVYHQKQKMAEMSSSLEFLKKKNMELKAIKKVIPSKLEISTKPSRIQFMEQRHQRVSSPISPVRKRRKDFMVGRKRFEIISMAPKKGYVEGGGIVDVYFAMPLFAYMESVGLKSREPRVNFGHRAAKLYHNNAISVSLKSKSLLSKDETLNADFVIQVIAPRGNVGFVDVFFSLGSFESVKLRGYEYVTRNSDYGNFNFSNREAHSISDVTSDSLFSVSPEIKYSDDGLGSVEVVSEDVVDVFGRNTMHFLAAKGKMRELKFLVDKRGFDPLRPDSIGLTPLDVAEYFRHGELIMYLKTELSKKRKLMNPYRMKILEQPITIRKNERRFRKIMCSGCGNEIEVDRNFATLNHVCGSKDNPSNMKNLYFSHLRLSVIEKGKLKILFDPMTKSGRLINYVELFDEALLPETCERIGISRRWVAWCGLKHGIALMVDEE